MPKICPLIFATYKDATGLCRGDECAWWCEGDKMCAMLALGEKAVD
jgi:hypothetical protein